MKLIINGVGGRMGKALTAMIQNSPDITLHGGVDAFVKGETIVDSLEKCPAGADCIIDFSNHTGTKDLMDYAVQKGLPVVVCTTGHTAEELSYIQGAAQHIPVFHSGNMSVGIALLMELARQTAKMFPDADIEIVETHHNQKLDAPSGTALMLAKAIASVRDCVNVLGRSGNGKRNKNEIGIHAVRRGGIVGIHEVIVSTANQSITLKHEAHDRALFAEGALTAAAWLTQQKPGLYDMKDMVK